jgi:hypothetical protein
MVPIDAAPVPNCRLPNHAILLEGCRCIDERGRIPVAVAE